MQPLTLDVSFFGAPAMTSTRPTLRVLTWTELAQRLSVHERWTTKDGRGWSPATYAPKTTRANRNVRGISCFVGDRDHATFDDYFAVRDHIRDLGLAGVLHSTYQNRPMDDVRFRIIVPFTKPVLANGSKADGLSLWLSVWRRATAHLLFGLNDANTKDMSRFFYLPSAPPDGEVFAEVLEGEPLDWEALPAVATTAMADPEPTTAGAVQYLGYRILDFLVFGAAIGHQREMALAATRGLLASGRSVEETADLVWRALAASPCGDPSDPWTRDHAIDLARDLAKRQPTPLPELKEITLHPAPPSVARQVTSPIASRAARRATKFWSPW